jgi:hypothetical protein
VRLRAKNASVIMTRVLRKVVIAATEIRSDHPNRGMSKSLASRQERSAASGWWRLNKSLAFYICWTDYCPQTSALMF